MQSPNFLGADEALRHITEGHLSCVELMQAYFDEIERREPEIRAWVHLDRDRAFEAARRADQTEKSSRGPLHGLPIGVKDLFDTADLPTEWGNNLWKGRRTEKDAAAVTLLRRAVRSSSERPSPRSVGFASWTHLQSAQLGPYAGRKFLGLGGCGRGSYGRICAWLAD